MKAKDLMIGDYVSLGGKTMQVLSIGEENHNGDRLLTLHELGGIWQSIADHAIEPIALRDISIKDSMKDGSGVIFVAGVALISRDPSIHEWEARCEKGVVSGIRYLHELQHAIRLIGGKEIAL